MKKLLYTFTFLATIFVASAQSNTLTFTGSVDDNQTFSFGSTAGVYLFNNIDFTQGGAYIQHASEVISPSTISESFSINTDGSAVNATLRFRYRKAAASTVSGVISVAGQADFPFTLDDSSTETDGSDDNVTNVNEYFNYTTVIPLSTTATNVTFTIDEFVLNTATTARLRLYSVQVNGVIDTTLSTNDIDAQETKITAYPNPVTNSFQLGSNRTIETVKLYNITGRLLKTFKLNANYDISDLSSGIYIVKVDSESGSETLKIVKK